MADAFETEPEERQDRRPHPIVPSSLAYHSTQRPRQESVRVRLDEVRRTLEHLDRRHAKGQTPGTQRESQQTGATPREEPVRVPLDEIHESVPCCPCRTIDGSLVIENHVDLHQFSQTERLVPKV